MKKDLLNHLNTLSKKSQSSILIEAETTASETVGRNLSKTGKDLDTFDPSDAEHNIQVYGNAMKKYGQMKRKGEISPEQYLSIQGELEKRAKDFIEDEKLKQQAKAVEQGLDTVADVAGMVLL